MLEKPDTRTRQALDLDRLLGLLAARTRTAPGRERLLALSPVSLEEGARRAASISECRARFEQGGAGVSMPNADPRPWLARLDEGAVRLELPDMRDVAQALEAAESARAELLGLDAEVWPQLTATGRAMPELETLSQLFRKTFDSNGEIRDDATQDLARIRRALLRLEADVQSRLERLVRSLSSYLAEEYVTLRHDRHVLPVKAEHHRKVPGLLHDQSGSGGTFFIEPYEVVELNNRLSETRLEEQAEIDRVLRALTRRLQERRPDLGRALELLARLDALEGLARTSLRWGARAVERSPEPRLRLRGARHPLLLEQRGGPDSVVALELELDRGHAGLLVTGPNMGGKTVVLKTVGLLVFLASCGAHIPADSGSCVGDFEGLWADIGDAQSLERDLSTFAGHLKRLDEMLAAAGPNVLLLCDELGTGTDPAEGAALSRAFLEGLQQRGARVIATSHLGALKLYAGGESGYCNASMEFEPSSFRPTYRLREGVPGQSHALEMAARLGCLGPVLDRARALIEPSERDAQRLLEELATLTRSQQSALQAAGEAREKSEHLSAELERRIAEWEEQRGRLEGKARQAADQLVEDTERWVADLKAAARSQNREAMREARRRLEERLRSAVAEPPAQAPGRHWEPGQRARIPRLAAVVEVLSPPGADGRLWASNKGLKIQVRASELEPLEAPAETAGRSPQVELAAERSASGEVDLRGLTAEEAGQELEKALDDALLTGVQELRIIHGKGTGALRKRVQEVLRSSTLVRSHRLGNWNEGGTGVTVADLAQ